jgi:hypothetical protein
MFEVFGVKFCISLDVFGKVVECPDGYFNGMIGFA